MKGFFCKKKSAALDFSLLHCSRFKFFLPQKNPLKQREQLYVWVSLHSAYIHQNFFCPCANYFIAKQRTKDVIAKQPNGNYYSPISRAAAAA